MICLLKKSVRVTPRKLTHIFQNCIGLSFSRLKLNSKFAYNARDGNLCKYYYLSSGDSTCLDRRLPMVFCNSSMSEAYCTGSAAGGGVGESLRDVRSAAA